MHIKIREIAYMYLAKCRDKNLPNHLFPTFKEMTWKVNLKPYDQ